GVDPFSNAMCTTQVLCPDARGQAVVVIVGVPDYFFFVVEWRDGHDWPEDFFAVCAARDRQTGDDRGRKEIPFAAAFVRRFWHGTAKRYLAAFFLGEIDVELYFLKLRFVHDRALIGFLVEWIAHCQLRR